MTLLDNARGNYRFLSGIAAYSSGVVSLPGYEVVHVVLQRLLPYREGVALIDQFLARQGRTRWALCGIELRLPAPLSFAGFAKFNDDYVEVLDDWDLFVGEHNPVARTNVAPAVQPPDEACLYAFSYTAPHGEISASPTFVVAGAGELVGQRLMPEAVVRPGDVSPEALGEKAVEVMGTMEQRLVGLEVDWSDVTAIDIYTVHPLQYLLSTTILGRTRQAAIHGVRWYFARPPIVDLEFEMDLRGVRREVWLS